MARTETKTRERLARVLTALELPDHGGPLAALGARALLHACPAAVDDRERRLIASAEQLALDPRIREVPALAENAYAYLAVACCSLADSAGSSPSRDSALVAAIAFAAAAGENPRAALGVEDRLRALARDTRHDGKVRYAIALLLALRQDPTSLRDTLEDAFERCLSAEPRAEEERTA